MIAPVGREYFHYGMIATGDHGYLYRCAMPHPADSVPISAAVRSDGLGQSTDLVGGDVSPPYEGMSVTLPYPE